MVSWLLAFGCRGSVQVHPTCCRMLRGCSALGLVLRTQVLSPTPSPAWLMGLLLLWPSGCCRSRWLSLLGISSRLTSHSGGHSWWPDSPGLWHCPLSAATSPVPARAQQEGRVGTPRQAGLTPLCLCAGDDMSGSGSGDSCPDDVCGKRLSKNPSTRQPETHAIPKQSGHGVTGASSRSLPSAFLLFLSGASIAAQHLWR